MFSRIKKLLGNPIPVNNTTYPTLDKTDLAQFKAIVNATVHSYEDIGYDKCIERLSYLEAVLDTLHKGTISSAEAADVYTAGIREVKTIHNKVILAQIAAGVYISSKTSASQYVLGSTNQSLLERMRAYQNQSTISQSKYQELQNAAYPGVKSYP